MYVYIYRNKKAKVLTKALTETINVQFKSLKSRKGALEPEKGL